MGQISMATRDELVGALAGRYASSSRKHRGRILDEFVAVSGFHRKHAMRLLRAGQSGQGAGPRPARRIYSEAVRDALIVIWEAADRVCGKRLRPLVPILVEAMERHGHLQLAPEMHDGLVSMSAATIDRALCKVKQQATGGTRRRSASSPGVRHSVPVRTFDGWNDPAPGFMEVDLVAHSGPTAEGSFLQTLTMTDIATGWTECAPLLVREQTVLIAVLSEIRKRMPFPLLGFDTDNDSVFMNETVQSYCKEAGVESTRCRPYRKNDQAWVEQKNGAVVRRIVGYRRYVGLEAAAALGRLYMSVRLYVNFFQPSFKLASKARDGARVTKRYHPPATPYQRLLADPRTSETIRAHLGALQATLDPVRLLAILAMLARHGACAWLPVAPLLPSPALRAAATAAPGRGGKAGSPIEQESGLRSCATNRREKRSSRVNDHRSVCRPLGAGIGLPAKKPPGRQSRVPIESWLTKRQRSGAFR